jgi:hypothetical protein
MERPHAGRLVSFVQHLEEIPSYQWFKGHRRRQHPTEGSLGATCGPRLKVTDIKRPGILFSKMGRSNNEAALTSPWVELCLRLRCRKHGQMPARSY